MDAWSHAAASQDDRLRKSEALASPCLFQQAQEQWHGYGNDQQGGMTKIQLSCLDACSMKNMYDTCMVLSC